jgi:hypothetical protein
MAAMGLEGAALLLNMCAAAYIKNAPVLALFPIGSVAFEHTGIWLVK